MSKYYVNKIVRKVAYDDAALEAFRNDPKAILRGHELTEQESEALVKLDYRTLYALGAHPYLLNAFMARTCSGDRRTFMAEFRKSIQSLGRPDFST
jgi:hypothetical protein